MTRNIGAIAQRPRIGCNAYDELDAHGLLVYRYGPQICHTNGRKISERPWLFMKERRGVHRLRSALNQRASPRTDEVRAS